MVHLIIFPFFIDNNKINIKKKHAIFKTSYIYLLHSCGDFLLMKRGAYRPVRLQFIIKFL